MNRSLEAAIEAARARGVPWDAERSARVERRIAARRVRSVMAAPLARWALGGLASAALYASVIHVSEVLRERAVLTERFDEAAPPPEAPPDEASLDERPVGDGGFD